MWLHKNRTPLFRFSCSYSLFCCCSCSFQVVSFLLLNMSLHLEWSLHSIINSETVSEASLSSLLAKRKSLSEQLEYFLNSPPELEGNRGNLLACRVSILLRFVVFQQNHTSEIIWIGLNVYGNSNSSLMKYLLYPRFVYCKQNCGFCSERQIFLQQSWKGWDIIQMRPFFKSSGTFVYNSSVFQVSNLFLLSSLELKVKF